MYLLSATLSIATDVSAYEKTFAWDANDEPDLEGYVMYSRVGDPCPPYNYVDTYPEDELANPLMPMVKAVERADGIGVFGLIRQGDNGAFVSDVL